MALITPATFRTNFPEFTSAVTFPTTQIQFWLDIAYKQVRAAVWQDQLDLGVQLYVAHNIVLEAQAQRASNTGGIPGVSNGPVNNKSVDKVSTGYDTITASEEGAGNWNMTVYGTRFMHLVRLYGAGGIQI